MVRLEKETIVHIPRLSRSLLDECLAILRFRFKECRIPR